MVWRTEANLDRYLSLVTQENETSVEIKYFDNKPRILSREFIE